MHQVGPSLEAQLCRTVSFCRWPMAKVKCDDGGLRREKRPVHGRLLAGGRKGLRATVRGLAPLGCRPTVLRSVRSFLEINCHPLSVGRVLDGHVFGMVHNQGESGNRPLLAVSDG